VARRGTQSSRPTLTEPLSSEAEHQDQQRGSILAVPRPAACLRLATAYVVGPFRREMRNPSVALLEPPVQRHYSHHGGDGNPNDYEWEDQNEQKVEQKREHASSTVPSHEVRLPLYTKSRPA